MNEPVEIFAGDQLTPRRDNAWSSRERCDRVTSSTLESSGQREASRWRKYDEAMRNNAGRETQSMADLMQVITQITNQGFFGTWTGQKFSIRR